MAGCAPAPPPAPANAAAGEDWPCFLGPRHDSTSTETGILTTWPASGLRVVWQAPLGDGFGPPAVSRGNLYHFDRYGNKARLTCRHATTGQELWRFEYPTNYVDSYGYNGGPRASPVVDEDRVYLLGPEGVLHCVSAADGKSLWVVDTKAKYGVVQNFFGVGSTPLVEGDLLIVPVGGSPPGPPPDDFRDLKGNGSGVVAFDKLTGKERYRITDELASYSSPVPATIDGRRWCFYWARGGLIGWEPASGKVDFHFPWRAKALESAVASNPVIVGDRVFLSECYGDGSVLLKVRPGGCEQLWSDAGKYRDKSLQCHWNTPIHVNGYLYACSGRHTPQAELRCVELTTGKVTWTEPGLARSSLLLVDGHFVCITEYGLLLLLKVNPQKYEEVARMDLGRDGSGLLQHPCWAAPVLAHGRLYLRSEHRLVCLELIPQAKT